MKVTENKTRAAAARYQISLLYPSTIWSCIVCPVGAATDTASRPIGACKIDQLAPPSFKHQEKG